MPYSIMLDAGHGGRDFGAVYNGRQEKDDTLRLVLAIGEILQNNGVDVEYTRTTDLYQSPYEKAMEANDADVDYFVSIHRNSFPTDNILSGVESLVYDLEGVKLELAKSINEQLETTGFVNLGVQARPNLVILSQTKMPAVMVELGFLNSNTDNTLFDNNFDDIAQAVASGILDTLEREEPGDSLSEVNSTAESRAYYVQVGSYRNPAYANRLLNELLDQDYTASIEEEDGFFRVRVGSFDSLEDASDMEQRLKQAGYPTIIIQ